MKRNCDKMRTIDFFVYVCDECFIAYDVRNGVQCPECNGATSAGRKQLGMYPDEIQVALILKGIRKNPPPISGWTAYAEL